MMLIIDANIIIAALIRKSFTREVMVRLSPHIYYPELMLVDIEKYRELIKAKAKLSEASFLETKSRIFKHVKIIPTSELLPYIKDAEKIMAGIDSGDAILVAAALASKGSIIWSNDPHLKKQSKVRVLTTEEISEDFRDLLLLDY